MGNVMLYTLLMALLSFIIGFFVAFVIKITFKIIRWNTNIKTDEYKRIVNRNRRIKKIRVKNSKKLQNIYSNELIDFYYGK